MKFYVTEELEKQVRKNIPKAQYYLDTNFVNCMTPYMPMVTGTFRNMVNLESASLAGTGKVCVYKGVQGRYLYEGKVMVNAKTGKGARRIPLESGEVIFRHVKGAKLIASGRDLKYTSPQARPHWDEVAIENHMDDLLNNVKRILANGR